MYINIFINMIVFIIIPILRQISIEDHFAIELSTKEEHLFLMYRNIKVVQLWKVVVNSVAELSFCLFSKINHANVKLAAPITIKKPYMGVCFND